MPPLGSGEGGAPVASRSHPCSIRTPSVLLLSLLLLAGRHANGERRRRAGGRAPGLPLPSTGGAWRCLRQGAVRVAPPLPVGATLRTRHRTCSYPLLAGRHANGERYVGGCRVVSWLPHPHTGVLWRCLRGGVVEVALPWSAVASAPSYPATAPYCTAGGAARQRGTAAAGGWEGARLAGPVHRGCMEVPRRRSGGAGSPAAGLEHCIY